MRDRPLFEWYMLHLFTLAHTSLFRQVYALPGIMSSVNHHVIDVPSKKHEICLQGPIYNLSHGGLLILPLYLRMYTWLLTDFLCG